MFVTKELNQEEICWVYTQGSSIYIVISYITVIFLKINDSFYHHFIVLMWIFLLLQVAALMFFSRRGVPHYKRSQSFFRVRTETWALENGKYCRICGNVIYERTVLLTHFRWVTTQSTKGKTVVLKTWSSLKCSFNNSYILWLLIALFRRYKIK